MKDAPSQHAEQVGEATTEAITAAENTTAAVIETAQAEVEQAQDQAAAIARAAIETQLGQQIETLRTEFQSWQNQHETRLAEIMEDNRMIQDGLTAALERIAQALTPPAPSVSTPTLPAAEQTAPAPAAPAAPIPEVQGAGDALPAAPISEPRQHRRRAI